MTASKPATPETWARIGTADRTVEITDQLGRIDLDNLHDEVEDVNAQSLWWATLSATAKRRVGEAELHVTVLEAQLGKAAREAALSRGEKYTVDSIRSEVQTHPELIDAKMKVLGLQEQADMLAGAMYSLVRKASTIESLAQLVVQEELARRDPTAGLPRRTPRTPLPAG